MTITLASLGTVLDRVKSVVVPSPVKLSSSLSAISNVAIASATICPQKVSAVVGAEANSMLPPASILNPSVILAEVLLGFWITPLTEICNCAGLEILQKFPSSFVGRKTLLTPSKATFSVCAVPLPTLESDTATLLNAFADDVANLI